MLGSRTRAWTDAEVTGPMSNLTFCFALDDAPRLVSVRGSTEAMLGYSQREFSTAKVHLRDLIHPDDTGAAKCIFSPDCESRSGCLNLRLRHADGRIRCVKGHYTKRQARPSDKVLLELTLEDAGNLREPGDAYLLASFKSLIDHTDDSIYIKNRNHVFLAASSAVPFLTDNMKDRSELVGMTDYDLHPEAIADLSYQLENQAFAENRRVNQVRQIAAQDGSNRWIDNRKYPITGPGGEVVGIFGIAPDITEYVEAERRLRESEESLRDAQEIAELSNYVLDIPNKIWHISPELERLLGIDAAYGREFEKIWPLIHPDDRAKIAARFKGYFAGELTNFDSEYRILRHTDGAMRWVHTRGRLEVDSQGKALALRGTVQDVTNRKDAEAELRESKELLQLFIQHAPAALAMFDREMRYLAASRRWLEMHGLPDANIFGRSHYDVFPEIPESWREEHRRCLAGELLSKDERCLLRADGTAQWVQREIIPWRTSEGAVGGIVVFAEDVTQRKTTEDRLRLAASVFTGAREGITITDRAGTILEVNEAFIRITGYTREEVLGKNPRLLQSGLQSKEFYQSMWDSLLREGHWSGEIWNRTKGGDIYAEMLNINAIYDANGGVTEYIGLFTDITEIKEREQRLERITQYDALTGLPNRALFTDRLRQAMAQAHRRNSLLAVAYFDLDGFKAINDRCGHSTGDALLTALAFRMKRALREGDTLARLGGDELAAMILDLDNAEACKPMLNRLLAAAAEEAQIGEVVLRVSASAGVALFPQTAEDMDADVLLRQAGQAMYQAKLAGRNRFRVFDPSEDQIVRGRHENIEHIRQALTARQFVLYYQPIVNMRTGKVVGAEALIRWQHPERGLVPPGMFLPVIEEHPLAVEVGQWVIETALTQMEAWQAEGFDLPVSVNVGALELQQPDFADRLRERLAAHPHVKPSSLEMEVLETSAMQDVVSTSQVLMACREIGVSIGLDDFGTGYSSLTYLKRLPANVLKIDQSFVRDMLEEPENVTILEGVLGLAAAFDRQVIAEGVETTGHGLMLLQLGCDLAQGYGVAAAMPAGELRAWASSWRADSHWADVPPVRAENRPVLYASVEHRAWLGALEAYLQGRRAIPPLLDASQCRVGMWLEGEKQSARGMLSAIQAIESLHRELHELAAEIFESQSEGPNPAGLARLRRLHHLQDKCLRRLKTFA